MTTKANQEKGEKWRRLCELIAHEPDPLQLSKLVDQLLLELDSRRQELSQMTGGPKSPADNK